MARGFTLAELLVVVAMLAVLAFISFPLIGNVLAQSRARGGTDAIMGAIRDARGRAVASGWQYRVIGFTTGGTVPNSFRIEGRDPAAPSWPSATTVPPASPANQYVQRWTSLPAEFGGAQLAVALGGNQFIVTFDGRGSVPAAGCVDACQVGFPISVLAPGGTTKNLAVTLAGGVRTY